MVGKAEMNGHVFLDLASRILLIKNMTQKPKLPSPVSSMRVSNKFTIIRYSSAASKSKVPIELSRAPVLKCRMSFPLQSGL